MRKHWKTYFWIIALVITCVFAFTSKEARAQDISKLELYRGMNEAVKQASIQQGPTLSEKIRAKEGGSAPTLVLASRTFFQCDKQIFSLDVWLVSHHTGSKHSRELNEKNYGYGVVYSCDHLSVALDEMINSNKGKAMILSLVWTTDNLVVGPIFVNGSIGYARLSYEVPRYNVTLYDSTAVAFIGVGLTILPNTTLNLAPVPKMAGKAWITWLKHTVFKFDEFFQLKK